MKQCCCGKKGRVLHETMKFVTIRTRIPRLLKLLLITLLYLLLSFAAYIGFTEKYPHSLLSYFHHTTKVLQVDIQQTTPDAVAVNLDIPRLPNDIVGQGSSLFEKDVKRLAANNKLYTQEKQAEVSEPSKSIEKQTRNTLVTANKKASEEKLWPTLHEIQVEDKYMTAAVSLNHTEALDATPTSNNKKVEKHIVPTSNLEEKKSKGEMSQAKKPSEAVYVISEARQKKVEGRDATRASKLQQLKAKYVTMPSRAKQTTGKQSRDSDTAQEHSAQFPAIMDHNASATYHVPAATPHERLKAANFKAEPHWDFDDEYLLDNSTQQSSCPDSLRDKAAKSDWLKNLFLPNITIFMDKSHFNDHEWERLEHFVPPFGFMELNYSLVQEVLTMLPPKPYHQVLFAHNSSQMSRCVTCAVVANGGILNNSRMGQEIDSHDYVFRVSGAVIKGYEKDVGTRTSFYGFTSYSLVSSVTMLQNQGFKKVPMGKETKYLHFLEGERDYEWLKALLLNTRVRKGFLDYYGPRPRDKFDNNFNLDKYFVIHPDFLRYMKNRFLKSRNRNAPYWRIYRPTTGAFLLLTALHLCDQVSAYGYITEGYQKYSDHYYDKVKKKLIFYVNHDFDLERRVWKKLHDANIMKIYQRS